MARVEKLLLWLQAIGSLLVPSEIDSSATSNQQPAPPGETGRRTKGSCIPSRNPSSFADPPIHTTLTRLVLVCTLVICEDLTISRHLQACRDGGKRMLVFDLDIRWRCFHSGSAAKPQYEATTDILPHSRY